MVNSYPDNKAKFLGITTKKKNILYKGFETPDLPHFLMTTSNIKV